MTMVRKCVSRMYGVLTCDSELKSFFDNTVPHFINKVEEGDESHELEWTNLYESFECLMESKLEDIALEMGFSNHSDFFSALRASLASASEGKATLTKEQRMMDMLVASYDYEKFVVLMKIKARNRLQTLREMEREREESKQAGDDEDDEEEEKDGVGEGKKDDVNEMFLDDDEDD